MIRISKTKIAKSLHTVVCAVVQKNFVAKNAIIFILTDSTIIAFLSDLCRVSEIIETNLRSFILVQSSLYSQGATSICLAFLTSHTSLSTSQGITLKIANVGKNWKPLYIHKCSQAFSGLIWDHQDMSQKLIYSFKSNSFKFKI